MIYIGPKTVDIMKAILSLWLVQRRQTNGLRGPAYMEEKKKK